MVQDEKIVVEYAGFWRRLAAILIDGLVISGINWVLLAPWRWAFAVSHPWRPETWFDPFPFEGTLVFLSVLVGAVYFIAFWVWRGQTPGKIIMNIKVLRQDGSMVVLQVAAVRYLGYIICGMTLGIGFLALAFDERRQGLHDKMALTVVVKVPPVKLRIPEVSMG